MTAWRINTAVLLRRAADAVGEQVSVQAAGTTVSAAPLVTWLKAAAQAQDDLEHGRRTVGLDSASAAAVTFAESLGLTVVHESVVTARTLPGSRRSGTHLACACGDEFGVVSDLAPTRGGNEAALGRHSTHLLHVRGITEDDVRRAREQRERRLAAAPVHDPWAHCPWERPAAQDWLVRARVRLRHTASTGDISGVRRVDAGTELTMVMSGKAGEQVLADTWSTEEPASEALWVRVESAWVLEVLDEIPPWSDNPPFAVVTDEMREENPSDAAGAPHDHDDADGAPRRHGEVRVPHRVEHDGRSGSAVRRGRGRKGGVE